MQSLRVTGQGPGSPAAMRTANQQRVLATLEPGTPMTQAGLARATGLAPSTISNIVRDLLADDMLSTVGRQGHGQLLQLTRRAGVAVGIDVGHRHITAASVTRVGEVIAERRVDIGVNVSVVDATRIIAEVFADVVRDTGEEPNQLIGVGLGVPTPVDRAKRQVAAPSILPGWVGVDMADIISDRLGVAITVDNDANLGALSELTWGAGRGHHSLAYLKLSEGVGAGLILDGQLYRGRHGIAGELGHTTMDEYGIVCRCGNRGCLETIVAARAVIDLLEPVRGPGLTIARIVELAAAGDVACIRVLSDTARHIGVAVANLCNVFNPEIVILGGELAQAANFLLPPLREVVRRQGVPVATQSLQIERGGLGARAHVLGAALLAMREAGAVALV